MACASSRSARPSIKSLPIRLLRQAAGNGGHAIMRAGQLAEGRRRHVRVGAEVRGAQRAVAEVVGGAESPERGLEHLHHVRPRLGAATASCEAVRASAATFVRRLSMSTRSAVGVSTSDLGFPARAPWSIAPNSRQASSTARRLAGGARRFRGEADRLRPARRNRTSPPGPPARALRGRAGWGRASPRRAAAATCACASALAVLAVMPTHWPVAER